MRVRVAGLVMESDKILVLSYNYPNGRIYALPGGNIEAGEFAPQTLVREFREELGLEVQVGALQFVGEMQAQAHVGQTLHLIFQATILEGTPLLNAEETSAESFVWLDREAIPDVAMYPDLDLRRWQRCESCDGARYMGDVMQRVWS